MVDWLVDAREPNKPESSICKELRELGMTIERKTLEVGDFISYDCDDEIIIVSRKAGDLFDSIFSGHFADELNRCINLIESFGGGKLFWLQEGIWSTAYPSGGTGGMNYFKRSGAKWFRHSDNHNGASENVFGNVQLSLQSAGIHFVQTGTLHETALMLKSIHRRGQEGWPSKLTSALRRPTLKWSEDSRVQRLMGLWPHLKEQAAINLVAEFGSIPNIINLALEDEKKLLAVDKIGKTGLKNFQEALK